jgi:F0F1-type ATP synthase membrane subunit b/b'
MSAEKDKSQGHVGQVVGLVSTLGRVVKQRIGEFATEANDEVRSKLSDAKRELEEELASAKEPAKVSEVSDDEP